MREEAKRPDESLGGFRYTWWPESRGAKPFTWRWADPESLPNSATGKQPHLRALIRLSVLSVTCSFPTLCESCVPCG